MSRSNCTVKFPHEGLVSVIVPTFNQGSVICDTLNSIFHQKYRPIELIVVDDGSTDNTQSIVNQWKKNVVLDSEFNFLYIYQDNSGACKARNSGIEVSKGEFINFIDSDDILAEDKIRRQVAKIRLLDENTVVYGDCRFFRQQGKEVYVFERRKNDFGGDELKAWLEGWFVTPHCMLWRRNDVVNLGPWDESLQADQDGEYMMRYFLKGGKLKYVPEAWCFYRQYSDPSTSIAGTNTRNAIESRFEVIRKIETSLNEHGRINNYSNSLALRYAKLANRSAFYYRDITAKCLSRAKELSDDGKLPDIFTLPLLSKCIGLTNKQRLCGFLRRMLRLRPRRQYIDLPKSVLNSITDLNTYDV